MDDSEAIARDLYYWVGEYHTAAGDRDAALARAEVAEGRVKRQDAILYELCGMLDCNADSELVGALRDFNAAWQADIARAEAADRERDEARERIAALTGALATARERVAALEGLLRELDDNGWIVVDHESDESCAVECSRCDAHERYDAMSNWSIKHDATCIVTRARELLGKE